jgi:hypothetical protein
MNDTRANEQRQPSHMVRPVWLTQMHHRLLSDVYILDMTPRMAKGAEPGSL